MSDEQEFEFLISDVQVASDDTAAGGDDLDRQAQLPAFLKRATKVSISSKQLTDFWKEKVVGLTDTLSQAQADQAAKGFQVDEIAFSLGVGAQGGVFFVAQGSVEATITVTLRRSS